jgi:hypothetical protein
MLAMEDPTNAEQPYILQ